MKSLSIGQSWSDTCHQYDSLHQPNSSLVGSFLLYPILGFALLITPIEPSENFCSEKTIPLASSHPPYIKEPQIYLCSFLFHHHQSLLFQITASQSQLSPLPMSTGLMKRHLLTSCLLDLRSQSYPTITLCLIASPVGSLSCRLNIFECFLQYLFLIKESMETYLSKMVKR